MGAYEMDDSEAPQTVDAVLARDSNQQRPSFGQCLADCALDHYGLSGLLGRGGVGAASIPLPKSWIGAPTDWEPAPILICSAPLDILFHP
jgi:hypothetical protein